MRLSVAWIGLLLIVSIVVYFSLYGYAVYECFQDEENSVKEGFAGTMGIDDLLITTCPVSTKSYIDKNGLSLCCQGEVAGTRCDGRIVCSLSEGGAGLPTCGTWYKAYLDEKGRGKCPPSMPHYYESRDGTTKGCASSPGLNNEGTAPRTPTTKKCILYSNVKEEDSKLDSCKNVAMLERTTCFPTSRPQGATKSLEKSPGTLPPVVKCSWMNPRTGERVDCTTEESHSLFMDAYGKQNNIRNLNWRQSINTGDPVAKLKFCGPAERYSILKTLAFADLKKLKVFN